MAELDVAGIVRPIAPPNPDISEQVARWQEMADNRNKRALLDKEAAKEDQLKGLYQNGKRPTLDELYNIDPKAGAAAERQQQESQANQFGYDEKKHAAIKNLATDALSHVERAGAMDDPEKAQPILNQYIDAHRDYMQNSLKLPANEYMTLDQIKQIAGTTPGQEHAMKLEQIRAEAEARGTTYTNVQTPGGETQWVDAKHPERGPLAIPPQGQAPMQPGQPMQQQAPMPGQQQGYFQPQGDGTMLIKKPMRYGQPAAQPDGLTNIFAPQPQQPGQVQPQQPYLSPKSQQKQQELGIESMAEQQKAQFKAQQEQLAADKALLAGDEDKKARLAHSAVNLAGLGENLDKYAKETWPIADNNIAFGAKQFLGANDTVNNITQENGQIMVDLIKSMKIDSGTSPGQLLNTEKEWERQLAAATGAGSAKSRKEAWKKLTTELKQTTIAYEARRKQAAERLGQKYEPLADINTLPGPRIMQTKTGNAPIGSVKYHNGKGYRVVGVDQVEEVE